MLKDHRDGVSVKLKILNVMAFYCIVGHIFQKTQNFEGQRNLKIGLITLTRNQASEILDPFELLRVEGFAAGEMFSDNIIKQANKLVRDGMQWSLLWMLKLRWNKNAARIENKKLAFKDLEKNCYSF